MIRFRRRGFTLIELLVVIAIIAVLIALHYACRPSSRHEKRLVAHSVRTISSSLGSRSTTTMIRFSAFRLPM